MGGNLSERINTVKSQQVGFVQFSPTALYSHGPFSSEAVLIKQEIVL